MIPKAVRVGRTGGTERISQSVFEVVGRVLWDGNGGSDSVTARFATDDVNGAMAEYENYMRQKYDNRRRKTSATSFVFKDFRIDSVSRKTDFFVVKGKRAKARAKNG